ncbi:ATP-binding protein [Streptomyces sp. H27-D2]|uniref:ATP-binding protein n=1 Tax=Streptomyces sp. H27-D2 TaxID=3046304 RepID=UPI002DBC158D|nr:ATP-binding protein [Streptomyces sp. H27-D2]MEC4018800.1 ATP-binding protein [Streptomyces sp. H27-D2]
MTAARSGTDHHAYRDNFEHLTDELRRLDLMIQSRLATASLQNEAAPRSQAARTAYITRQEVDWLLSYEGGGAARDTAARGRPAGDSTAGHTGDAPDSASGTGGAAAADPAAPSPPDWSAALDALGTEIDARVERSLAAGVGLALPALGRLFGLSPVELRTVTICLAPELRRKYDRLYAYLQDDITRKRPSVDLVLELLCPAERQRWTALAAFAETAPLLRTGILRTVADPQSPSGSTGLARFLTLDPRICRFLLGSDELDVRLAGRARLYRPYETAGAEAAGAAETDTALTDGLWRLAEHHLGKGSTDRRKLVFYLHGPAGAGKRELARQTCHRLGVSLLSLSLGSGAPGGGSGPNTEELFRPAFREGLLQQAAVHLADADALLRDDARPVLASLSAAVDDFGWLVFLTGESGWTGEAEFADALLQPVAVPLPDVPRSTTLWRRALAGHTADPAAWAAELAAVFRMSPSRIRGAVELAEGQRLMEPLPRALTRSDVSAACRQQAGRKLGELVVKVRPSSGWEDLVLPADRTAHLRDICDQLRHRYQVYGSWGFGAGLSRGKGLSVLFSGPPGTGKTMAAEVLAHDLGLDLFKVDLSGVVSKYIGETEKNLARIFAEAWTSNAILFFDEADALFGKRTEVSDAHDRYANIETSYLLQKMEEYEGVVIMATNLRQNMDEAFTRRIRFIVEFPFPEAESRLRIWRTLIPSQAPVSADVDLGFLAREFPVAGGSIKNIVLNAAFLAAADGGTIGRRHILQGTRREFEKIGKLWAEPAPADGSTAAGGGSGRC